MALTQVKTLGIAADAVTSAKVADDQIDSEHLAADSIDTEHYAPNSVDLAAMAGIARGKLIVGNASGDPAYLAAGSNDQVLTMDANGDVGWEAASGGTPEGTAVQSTTNSNEASTKYLRADGDGTCSWQTAVDATKMPLTGGTFSGEVTFDTSATASTVTSTLKAPQNDRLNVWKNNDNGGGSWYITGGASNTVDLQWSSYSQGVIKFKNAGNVEVLDGNLVISTSGHGVDFSATTDNNNGSYGGSMGDELLHDYEYGTWTPVLKFNGGTTGQSYTTQDGRYTKVGNVVHVQANINVQDKGSSTGNVTMGGLPWLAKSTGAVLIIQGEGLAYTGTQCWCLVGTSANHYWNQQAGGDGNSANWTYLTHAAINNGNYQISGSYIAND